jgi:methionyl-tRNA formyltransferase
MEEKYLFVCYRDWAKLTHQNLIITLPIVSSSEDLELYIKAHPGLKYIFFVGWSELVPDAIINRFDCYCLHPSDLPKYRGGSPIQHQILENVLHSAVTMFRMDSDLDAGPIYKKHYLSLNSKLDLILAKISIISSVLINTFIADIEAEKEITLTPQDNILASNRKRRNPEDSEIKIQDFARLTAYELDRKIKCLAEPYPNAYVVCADGKKLYLKDSSL